jgi:hypothetical protein
MMRKLISTVGLAVLLSVVAATLPSDASAGWRGSPGGCGTVLASCTIAFTIAQPASYTGAFTTDRSCDDTSFATLFSGLVS